MTEAFQHDGPALIDAVVNRMELSMPPTIKLDQAVGFNLWVLKAVLDCRGDELIEILNVAGPRESKEPGAYDWKLAMLHLFFNRTAFGAGSTETAGEQV